MLTQYRQIVEDSTPGRLEGEGPMTAYLDELVSEGMANPDDELQWPNDGASSLRFGRRVLSYGSSGFVSLDTYRTETEAAERFDRERQEEARDIVRESDPSTAYWAAVSDRDDLWELNIGPDDVLTALEEAYGPPVDGENYETAYAVQGHDGVAWRLREPSWQRRVSAVMVGDDRVSIFDWADLVRLPEGGYCQECGQTGCTANT